ncbi:hypothetical protein L6164_029324 [Bauhinia variegata]|uniref:Uncharacterized protein n=1 Tax=Bauhinia variegata TaxID=167791 RepID=A0ACB9L8Y7_BAUVA|nr:hypothetical protein L6164_029324 [Bauhinia variegata]
MSPQREHQPVKIPARTDSHRIPPISGVARRVILITVTMVLISGTNKSVSQHPNVAQGITAHHNPNQQGIKNFDSARSQNLHGTGLAKGMAALDEFKYGFPSQGLATISNKWWGNSDTDGAGVNRDKAKVSEHGEDELKEKSSEVDNEARETRKDDNNVTLEGTALLTAVRKRAVEEGREALKLGVFRGYGAKKLGKREKMLLLQIFRSSLPRSWICN